jgi:hypothetical protein
MPLAVTHAGCLLFEDKKNQGRQEQTDLPQNNISYHYMRFYKSLIKTGLQAEQYKNQLRLPAYYS